MTKYLKVGVEAIIKLPEGWEIIEDEDEGRLLLSPDNKIYLLDHDFSWMVQMAPGQFQGVKERIFDEVGKLSTGGFEILSENDFDKYKRENGFSWMDKVDAPKD